MSPARTATATPAERGIELLDRVDYRLAETPAEKETIYRLRYRAYLQRGRDRAESATSRSPIGSTRCRTPGFSASISMARSRVPSASACRRRSIRHRPRWTCFPISSAGARAGQGHGRSDPLCRGSRIAAAISRIALCHAAAGLCRLRVISMPISGWPRFAPSTRRSTAACSCTSRWSEPRLFPGLIKPI